MEATDAMKDQLFIYEYDQSWIQVDGERSLISDLGDYFTYDVPNARFMPSFQNRMWDGKIRLLDYQTQRIYRGLIPYIENWCRDNDIELVIDSDLKVERLYDDKTFDVDAYISSLGLIHTPYDYQRNSFLKAITDNRATFLSPTNSGKSLIIYMMIRYYLDHTDEDILLCVPTIDLVSQMIKEFKDYAPEYDITSQCHKVFAGQAKTAPEGKRIIISTWQSIYKQPKSFFKKFKTVIIDEAHLASGDSLKGILQKASKASNRFGLTGTLDGLQYNRLVIEGLCGPVQDVTTNKELIDRGISSEPVVNCLVLQYPKDVRKANKSFTYPEEMQFVVENEKRNLLIAGLCKVISPEKNTLVLTAYKNHIKNLEAACRDTGKEVYVVTGDTPAEERERVRLLADKKNGIIIIATYGVFSTGINIKNLQYMIMATGSKSLVRVLQSIGRGLRRDGKGDKIVIIDVVDDFGYGKKKNYIVRHFIERIKIYIQQEFKYKIKNINM